jgi:hypothetical protein
MSYKPPLESGRSLFACRLFHFDEHDLFRRGQQVVLKHGIQWPYVEATENQIAGRDLQTPS